MNIIRKIKKIIFKLILMIIIIVVAIIIKKNVKYVDEVQATGQAKIATWSFNVSSTNIKKINIDLKENNIEEDVIFPGDKGEFDIVIDASDSKVNIEYNVKFENETRKPTNLKFSYNEKVVEKLKDLEQYLNGKILLTDEERKIKLNIKWFWNYETGDTKEQIDKNDLIDTKDCKEIKDYKFDVIVQGKQS